MRVLPTSPRHERGAIAVATSISLIVLLAFLGVVIDLGRMYVVKSELMERGRRLRPGCRA
jgi:uncharacterized membrane protein